MAEDKDDTRDRNDRGEEDILDFDFDEDLLGEEAEGEVIDLVDVVERGRASESVEEDIEGLEELLSDEEEAVKKEATPSQGVKAVREGVLSEEAEVKEGPGESFEAVGPGTQRPSGQEEAAGENTVRMEKVEEAPAEEEEPVLDLDEEIRLDEGLEGLEEIISGEEEEAAEEEEPVLDLDEEIRLDEGIEEILSEEDAGELKEELMEEAVEKEESIKKAPPKMPPAEEEVEEEEAIKEEVPPISEERLEAVVAKVVSDVLEKVAREVIPEVAERIIREEIDVLKKSIMPED